MNILNIICDAINAKNNFKIATVWQKGDKNRIYIKSDKDISAYLEFDEDLLGASFEIFSNCNQSPKWIANRVAEKKEALRWVFDIYTAEIAKINNNFSSYSEATQKTVSEIIEKVEKKSFDIKLLSDFGVVAKIKKGVLEIKNGKEKKAEIVDFLQPYRAEFNGFTFI